MGIDFLEQLAAVAAAGAPVIAVLVGICTAALAMWASLRGAIAVTTSVASSIASFLSQFSEFILDHANGFAIHLCHVLGLSEAFRMAGVSFSLVSGVLVAVAGLFAVCLVLVGTVFAYRKARLVANIISGSGVQE